jgi:hypothetical protein
MRKIAMNLALISCLAGAISSCKKTSASETVTDGVSAETKTKIARLGFGTDNVVKTEDGYLVEGDINLTDELLNSTPSQLLLRVGEAEQYRTTNLVKALPRVIKVKVTNLGTAFIQGTDLAIARYNALGLKITFQRITSGTANITIKGFNQGPSGGYITLGSSGFPTSTGNPYSTIKMNTNAQAYGSNPDVNYVGSVIQHEIGHCIGMRHTDYYNRAISCGGTATNEGASNIGAILIPGTPSTATLSAASWMLACSDGGNRTFNSNDITGLNYLYK